MFLEYFYVFCDYENIHINIFYHLPVFFLFLSIQFSFKFPSSVQGSSLYVVTIINLVLWIYYNNLFRFSSYSKPTSVIKRKWDPPRILTHYLFVNETDSVY